MLAVSKLVGGTLPPILISICCFNFIAIGSATLGEFQKQLFSWISHALRISGWRMFRSLNVDNSASLSLISLSVLAIHLPPSLINSWPCPSRPTVSTPLLIFIFALLLVFKPHHTFPISPLYPLAHTPQITQDRFPSNNNVHIPLTSTSTNLDWPRCWICFVFQQISGLFFTASPWTRGIGGTKDTCSEDPKKMQTLIQILTIHRHFFKKKKHYGSVTSKDAVWKISLIEQRHSRLMSKIATF